MSSLRMDRFSFLFPKLFLYEELNEKNYKFTHKNSFPNSLYSFIFNAHF